MDRNRVSRERGKLFIYSKTEFFQAPSGGLCSGAVGIDVMYFDAFVIIPLPLGAAAQSLAVGRP